MKTCNTGLLLVVIFFLSSCGDGKELKQVSVFDMEAFIGNEINELEGSEAHLEKTLITGGNTQTKVFENPDWQSELQIFSEPDLKKPAIAAMYKRDSTCSGNNCVVSFTATDDAARIKTLRVEYTGAEPVSVFMVRQTRNMYQASVDTLVYHSRGNYSVTALGSPTMGKDMSFRLEGRILNYSK